MCEVRPSCVEKELLLLGGAQAARALAASLCPTCNEGIFAAKESLLAAGEKVAKQEKSP